MSVEEMCQVLEDYSDLSLETVNAIIAALKAGQEMRDTVKLHPEDGDIEDLDGFKMIDACGAWDAATKEDV